MGNGVGKVGENTDKGSVFCTYLVLILLSGVYLISVTNKLLNHYFSIFKRSIIVSLIAYVMDILMF